MPRVIHTAQALVDEVAVVQALPRRGGNVMATAFARRAGGAVTILLAAARQGAECVHAGAHGTGPNGDLVRSVLLAEGVQLSAPPVRDRDTGICFVMVEATAERTFVTTLGAEREVTAGSLATSAPQPGDLVCASGYSFALPSTREPLLAWLGGLPDGVLVVLDPGAAFADLEPSLAERVLGLTDVWTGNAEESAHLTGLDEMGAAAVDTNGAGDTHTGVVVACRALGLDWVEAARRANAAAAIKVTRRGPDTSPSAAEVDAFLADHPERLDEGQTLRSRV